MGSMNAIGMADAVGDGQISLHAALSYHLTCNHFPGLPSAWVPFAIEAMSAYIDEDFDRMITLPAAAPFAKQTKSVSEIVDHMHLYPFVEQMMGEDEDDEPEIYDLYNEEEVVEFEETFGL